ncbi:hypothetical protein Slin15195_G064710 [Septoria linicola]|uniref:Uncharacterized protein n=1 Tax=Septoria linicola TaxID=215465 RepID=A0A9Q9AP78_9PEZI|nr:hypothetical protein Slin14017_G115050 [Septoria linicola]USW53152.1 hypothetical protein Slin15195_G064710 [Septoria linicola]
MQSLWLVEAFFVVLGTTQTVQFPDVRRLEWAFIFSAVGEPSCEEESDASLGLSIWANLTHPGCYKFADTMMNASFCNPNQDNCELDFQAGPTTENGGFDAGTNYSQVAFNQNSPEISPYDGDSTELTLRLYEDGHCTDAQIRQSDRRHGSNGRDARRPAMAVRCCLSVLAAFES